MVSIVMAVKGYVRMLVSTHCLFLRTPNVSQAGLGTRVRASFDGFGSSCNLTGWLPLFFCGSERKTTSWLLERSGEVVFMLSITSLAACSSHPVWLYTRILGHLEREQQQQKK